MEKIEIIINSILKISDEESPSKIWMLSTPKSTKNRNRKESENGSFESFI